jgi:hypothetical protein
VEFGVVTAQRADAVQESKDLGSALATDRPGTDGLVSATLTVPRSAGNLLIFARQGPRAAFIEVG